MSLNALRTALKRRPFKAFVIVTSTGRRVPVDRAEQVSLSPDGELIVVALGLTGKGGAGVEVVTKHEFDSIEDAAAKPKGKTRQAPASKPAKKAPSAGRAAAKGSKSAGGTKPKAGRATPPRADDAGARLTAIATGSGGAVLLGTRQGQVVRSAPCGQIVMFPFEAHGVPVCTAIVQDAQGRPLLDLSGTQYDLHGVETGDNYLTLHMTHACEPGALVRVLIWPPDSASLETFSESRPVAEIQRVLRGADEQLRTRPKEPKPPRSYFDQLRAPSPRAVPRPSPSAAGDEAESDRFEAEELVAELRLGEPTPQTRLIDTIESEVLFDLVGCDLGSRLTRTHDDGRSWRLTVWSVQVQSVPIEMDIDPYARTVRVPGCDAPAPLAFVERTLRSAGCFRSLETLKAVLANGPQPGSGPVAILQNKAGASVELWPGFMREGRYILAPLLRDARRRVIVDLRGTSWGGGVDVVNEQAVLHLVSSAGVASESMLPRGVAVNVRTRRVYLDRGSGVTSAGVLQHLLQEFGAPSVFLEQLEEALGEGSGLPSIP